jgi:hypothetical protein
MDNDDFDATMADNDDIVSSLQDVELAVRDVEKAVQSHSGFWSSFFGICIAVWLFSLLSEAWHSKWRYALVNGVNADKVIIVNHPHDCAFLAAPLGEKYCHYDRVISTVRWATSTTNQPIESEDDGKTWTVFTPTAGEVVPRDSTIEAIMIDWKKVQE